MLHDGIRNWMNCDYKLAVLIFPRYTQSRNDERTKFQSSASDWKGLFMNQTGMQLTEDNERTDQVTNVTNRAVLIKEIPTLSAKTQLRPEGMRTNPNDDEDDEAKGNGITYLI